MINHIRGTLASACVMLVLCGFAAEADDEPHRYGVLFEIRTDADGKASMLFGTIHSDDPRILALPTPVQQELEATQELVIEVIPDTRAIIKSMVTMVYTDGRTLQGVLPPDLYREVVTAMDEIGMPAAAFKDFKPWAVVTLLSVPGSRSGDFLDVHLYKSALQAGKTVSALETIEEQLAVFDDLTDAEQISLLRETLASRQQIPEVYERLVAAYLNRDLGRLLELSDLYLLTGDAALAERFRRVAIDTRNTRMFERMQPLLELGGRFIAVGALHLPGEGGLLQLLAGAGYLVTPLY